MNIKNNLNTCGRSGRISAKKAFRLATGLIVICSGSFTLAQDDLPFSSGSTGADGAMNIPLHPRSRAEPMFGYDSERNEFVLFGGRQSGTYYPETWTSSDGVAWEKEAPVTFVSGRARGAMAWDGTTGNSTSGTLVMFGGNRADNTVMGDFWSWDGTDWTEITGISMPPARDYHSMVTDPVTGFIYLLGGESSGNAEYNDLWIWNGIVWTEITDFGTPPINNSSAYYYAAYDASDSAIVAYSENNRRTWKYKGGTWSEIATATTPDVGYGFTITYSPETGSCILFGGTQDREETWEFKDDEWALISTTSVPTDRYYAGAAFDSANNALVITQGFMDTYSDTVVSRRNYNTWSFKGDDWTRLSGRRYTFDMTARESGIWNFTSITIPYSAEVVFTKNAGNTPVIWLATEDVVIDGIVRVDGQNGLANNGADNYAVGGPGGAAGGLGGIRFDVSGNYAGTPGQGAGGGTPGVTSGETGEHGKFMGVYGNTLLLPMIAGSGGGGGAANASANGGHGGAGGGAILIASGMDITVNGTINADGGDRGVYGGASYGGDGSGGAIKLMADRVEGAGNLWARGGRNDAAGEEPGRIRIEAFFRPLAAYASPPSSSTAPIAAPDFGDLPTLTIVSVDGEGVAVPPSGNLQTPDVVFTESGTVTIVVGSTNVPEGTKVTLRITSSGEIQTLPTPGTDVLMTAGGTATFTATVPAGLGTIQAFTEFTPDP